MNHITVLSPHRDDAVFSLGLALSCWSQLNWELTVVNFFTTSANAPHATAKDAPHISRLRDQEDRRALMEIDPAIRIDDLRLLDAPLRLNVPTLDVFRVEPGDVQALGYAIRKYFLRSAVISPLGLGNHVDHLTVRAAALKNSSRGVLGFYEDLPYAAWSCEARLRERVQEAEDCAGSKLIPLVIRHARAVPLKRRVAALYHSQIDRSDANVIARYASKYGGGERLWIPRSAFRRMAIPHQSKQLGA